jgi:hypothetical protein
MDKNEWTLWVVFWICVTLAFFIVPYTSSTIIELEKIKHNCAVEKVIDSE